MVDRIPAVVATVPDRPVRCTRCGSAIQLCAFCEDPACANVICYRCLRRELRQSLDQPHEHGG